MVRDSGFQVWVFKFEGFWVQDVISEELRANKNQHPATNNKIN
ncbi:hypothetical protein HMPREF0204_14500 [Chryseobacterium gleum ATCC 35910]|uniref:Uncharacterized protein n=1 Tax=Chryseobacterium gleum ATCC 35910 TaxID=525257 RepID=A0ABN0AQU7_CHRGE|nr:hypothetical protein HMPREF0204_14500 [Chryseobacterium gleum ATCC 35910]